MSTKHTHHDTEHKAHETTGHKHHGHKPAHEAAHEHSHGHEHAHTHEGHHHHAHTAAHTHHAQPAAYAPAARGARVLTVRAVSGLSGDMMLAGLARMAQAGPDDLAALVQALKLPVAADCVRVEPREVNHVSGWSCHIDLPHEHAHRSYADIRTIIEHSALLPGASALALKAFALLAAAEGAVHGKAPEDVTFHEVGALDSILDICLVCALFDRLKPEQFVCSPLPLGDGGVLCAHGWLPVPAPAVLELLEGIPVCGFAGKGETLTPTAIALVKALGAVFGQWPAMKIEQKALVYGGKVFEGAPNGIIWAMGEAL